MTQVRRRSQLIVACIVALTLILADEVAVRAAAPVLVLTDGADFLAWQRQFNAAAAASAANIPEPAALSLLAVGLAYAVAAARRTRAPASHS